MNEEDKGMIKDAHLVDFYDEEGGVARLVVKLKCLQDQIDELARFIIEHVPGEPSRSEGAVECAIRIIKELQGAKAEAEYWKNICIGTSFY